MLKTKEPLVFISERRGESKAGNMYQFIKLANPANYENFEFFGSGVSVSGLATGDLVHCEFDLSGSYGKTNISVASLSLAK